ncbi:MAG: hypothetical protein U0992_04700 [Planctomycetaceae bacterium]
MKEFFAIFFVALFVGGILWSQWIYWTKMYPLMDSRGAIPRKWLWPPIWPYKRICIAESRSLIHWDHYWTGVWISVLGWGALAVLGAITAARNS